MKKIIFILLTLFLMSCKHNVSEPKLPEPIPPFKSGDLVYFKLDSSRAIIKTNWGLYDTDIWLYRISYKDKKGEIDSKFILSSELFKK